MSGCFHRFTVVCMVGALSVSTIANGQCDEQGREMYNEDFEVDKQIDSIRYVEEAVLRNNPDGDQIVEFMLSKSDPPDTRERWTVTYECSEDYDYFERVEVNGEWQVTVTLADLDGNPKMTISLSGLSAEVDLLDAANDDDLDLFLALAAATATHRVVASEILEKVAEGMPAPPDPPSPQTTPYQQCVAACPYGAPFWCEAPDDCAIQALCEVAACLRFACVNRCICTTSLPGNAMCLLGVTTIRNNCINGQIDNIIVCLEAP